MTSFIPSEYTAEQVRLFDTIESRLAIRLNDQQRVTVVQVTRELIASKTISHIHDLVTFLASQHTNQLIWQTIIQVVTIGETYFFRELDQWNTLRNSVLPSLINERRSQGKLYLRFWSAGCSTGEEPYSLAIILREMIPDIAAWNIHILATDLNMENLERARRGQYRPWSFRKETPDNVKQHWFKQIDGVYYIDASLRAMVTFSLLNLASFSRSGGATNIVDMDIIFCRNVLIYFDSVTTNAVVNEFRNALRDFGWLVLGASGGIVSPSVDFVTVFFANTALLQKPGGHRQQPPHHPVLSVTIPADAPRISVPIAESCSQTAKLDPVDLALQAANREEWTNALGWLADAEKINHLRPEIYYLRGVIELHQAEYDKALASLRRALYCDVNFLMAHYTLGEIYLIKGDYKKVSSEWNLAQKIAYGLDPQSPIPFGEDMTTGVFLEVLKFRLTSLHAQS